MYPGSKESRRLKTIIYIAWPHVTVLIRFISQSLMATIRVSDVNKDWTDPRARGQGLDLEPLMMTNKNLQHNRYRQLDLQ